MNDIRIRFMLIAAAVSMVLLSPTPAQAASEGRIQQVESAPGQVTFLLSATGLAPGQAVDPASIGVTLDGETVPATAQFTGESTTPTTRKTMLVIDASGSMLEDTRMPDAKAAAKSYLTSVPADVEVGLITFADDTKVVVAPTLDRAAVSTAIDGIVPKGSTELFDATDLAVKTLGPDGSRNIVLLSDGKDEGSETTQVEAVKSVARGKVTLDAVSIGTGEQSQQLAALTKAGNGTLVTATDAAGLTAAFESTANAVANEVTVTVTVPEGMAAQELAPLTATVKAGGEVITDSTVAQVIPAPTAVAGPKAAEPASGLFSNWFVVILALVGVFGALFGIASLAFNTIDPSRRKDGRIKRRLADAGVIEDEVHESTGLGDSAAMRNAISVTEKVVKGDRADRLNILLEAAGTPLRAAEWITVSLVTAISVGFVAALLTGFNPVAALAFTMLGGAVPWLVLKVRASKRRAAFYAQLPDMMQLMAGGLSAGYSLPQALDTVARESAEPMKSEIQRALNESRIGVPIEESLEAVATRMQSKDFHWVVMAITMNRRIGGNLGSVLRTVGDTLRERERLHRNVKALSAEGKLSVWILSAIPFLFAGYLMLTKPDYLGLLFSEPLGIIMMLGGMVSLSIGIYMMSKMIKIEV